MNYFSKFSSDKFNKILFIDKLVALIQHRQKINDDNDNKHKKTNEDLNNDNHIFDNGVDESASSVTRSEKSLMIDESAEIPILVAVKTSHQINGKNQKLFKRKTCLTGLIGSVCDDSDAGSNSNPNKGNLVDSNRSGNKAGIHGGNSTNVDIFKGPG